MGDWAGLIELVLIFGLVFGLGAQQLWALRRANNAPHDKAGAPDA